MTTKPPLITKMFDSLTVLADFARGNEGHKCRGKDKWAGGSFAQAQKWLRDGDNSYAAKSEPLLEKFEGLAFPTTRREWYNEVAGHVANVPAFLAGHPQAMRRRRKIEAPLAPITMFVDIFTSCSFNEEEILTRGAMVLALVRILAAHRPLQLYVAYASTAYSGTTVCATVRLDTAPLDLAHASYVLCAPSFVRQTMICTMRGVYVKLGNIPPLGRQWTLGEIATEIFGEGQQMLVVPAGIVSGSGGDPGEWIEAKIREAAPEILGDVREEGA